jgi:hypothetical protein
MKVTDLVDIIQKGKPRLKDGWLVFTMSQMPNFEFNNVLKAILDFSEGYSLESNDGKVYTVKINNKPKIIALIRCGLNFEGMERFYLNECYAPSSLQTELAAREAAYKLASKVDSGGSLSVMRGDKAIVLMKGLIGKLNKHRHLFKISRDADDDTIPVLSAFCEGVNFGADMQRQFKQLGIDCLVDGSFIKFWGEEDIALLAQSGLRFKGREKFSYDQILFNR